MAICSARSYSKNREAVVPGNIENFMHPLFLVETGGDWAAFSRWNMLQDSKISRESRRKTVGDGEECTTVYQTLSLDIPKYPVDYIYIYIYILYVDILIQM